MEVVVPDIGDFSDVEVVEVLVAEGDTVAVETPLIALETDKATMEVPSPHAGIVRALKIDKGDRVSAGDVIAVLEADEEQGDDSAAEAPAEPDDAAVAEDADAASGDAAASEAAAEPKDEPVVVPDLGDFSDVEVVEVLVAAGDEVERDDPLIVLETDKATMEVPATQSGRVVAVDVAKGDRVSSGDSILSLATTGGGAQTEAAAPQTPRADDGRARTASGKGESAAAAPAAKRAQPARRVDEKRFGLAHASPSVRKLARELGVDLGAVDGSGRKGRITADDLKAFVKGIMQGGGPAGRALPEVPDVDFASFGEVERQPLSRIQKIAGPRLQASWLNVPHVTQHDEADITELEAARQALKARAEADGIRLTPLAFVMRAAVIALDEFPVFRSSLDPDGQTLIVKKYFHIGFAADTPSGLVVPVVRDADKLDLLGLARALGELSEKAREGKLAAGDIQGGVFTISSLGGIGGTFFTPIVNAPEVAILGVSRSQRRPVYRDDTLEPRLILPLSLSYDHRVIDGATAVRFTTRLRELLADAEALAEGTS